MTAFVAILATLDSARVAAKLLDQSFCETHPSLCADAAVPYEGRYIGHDEPAVAFYSHTPGSGDSSVYTLTLPKDPPTPPTQDGTGGTFNFQLHPAFWFSMAMCDTQSYPEFTHADCTPDSDINIFDNPSAGAADYIGHHPGTAFMEMQFYPPGWVLLPDGISCDPLKWCAALNIDSLSQSFRGVDNNPNCVAKFGREPVNFANITPSGDPTASPLLFNSGDTLTVEMSDTPAGFQVVIHDVTTGESGSMTASPANGFAQVVYDPKATKCTTTPYAFHPMYSTSTAHTNVPWAVHTFNVGFSDEIGHFEYCDSVDAKGNCTKAGAGEKAGLDRDDVGCFKAPAAPFVAIAGCTGTADVVDQDFDGLSYQLTWPGSFSDPIQDVLFHPTSVLFSSPVFQASAPGGDLQNYSRVAFEADLPALENGCDFSTGAGCTNPPSGASFYPLYTTAERNQQCIWQLGGSNLPGTTNTFGGTSATGFGTVRTDGNFRRVLPNNPCSNAAGAIPSTLECAPTPAASCRVPIASAAAVMQLKANADPRKQTLSWTWKKGAATASADLGNPVASTDYAFCIYGETQGTPSLVMSATAPAGGTCSGKPCWTATSSGFKYKSKALSPDGLSQLILKAGKTGKARVTVKGQGADLPAPVVPLQQSPSVIVQVQNSAGTCWEADYSTATENDSAGFKAKSN